MVQNIIALLREHLGDDRYNKIVFVSFMPSFAAWLTKRRNRIIRNVS